MPKEKILFPLAPVYQKKGIRFEQARATAIWPEGNGDDARGAVDIQYTLPGRAGQTRRLRYDYLINATGPHLRFDMAEGLGPHRGHSLSVCTADHAVEATDRLRDLIRDLQIDQTATRTLIVGMGHRTCTCEGAAFGYIFNVDHELRAAGVRDRARVVYLTTEAELGVFGVGGLVFRQEGYETTSKTWTESLFRERGVEAILGAHVHRLTDGVVDFETLDGQFHELAFDFAMLLPPFGGVPLTAHAPDGTDITPTIFAPNGFMKVDADYTTKPYDEWRAGDCPKSCQSPTYDNVWAVGIAFAPPNRSSAPARPRTEPSSRPPRHVPDSPPGKWARLRHYPLLSASNTVKQPFPTPPPCRSWAPPA